MFVCVTTDIVALLRLEKCVDSVAVRASTLVFSIAIDALDIRAFELVVFIKSKDCPHRDTSVILTPL